MIDEQRNVNVNMPRELKLGSGNLKTSENSTVIKVALGGAYTKRVLYKENPLWFFTSIFLYIDRGGGTRVAGVALAIPRIENL